MSCSDEAVPIEKSTGVDGGGNEWPPLLTLGMLGILGCDLDN